MSDWSTYYLGRLGRGYLDYCTGRYRPFLDVLFSCSPASILEEGCGVGTFTRLLLERIEGLTARCCDLDLDMLELTSDNLAGFGVSLDRADASSGKPGRMADVVFSHGLLEHLPDRMIDKVLERQYASARKAVVHYVPTDGYDSPSFGDERLLPAAYWLERFRPSRFRLWNGGKDLVLVWDK